MDYEFNRMLEDARNLAEMARECGLLKLDNDLANDEPKSVLVRDAEMLYTQLDIVIERLNMLLDGIA